AGLFQPKRPAEVQLTLIDQGPDVLLKGVSAEGLAAIEGLTAFAMEHRLARLSVDQGLGPEALYEPQPCTVTLSGIPVAFPTGSFLQATEDGESAVVEAVRKGCGEAKQIADLFS